MLFAIGTKVRFKYTGDEGIITALLENGMVSVYLPKDDMEIPTFVEDLIKAEDYLQQQSSVKAKIVPAKKNKIPQAPKYPPIEPQYTILKSKGIQLAFEPIQKTDGIPYKYLMYLINDTQYAIIFSFQLYLDKVLSIKNKGQLPAMSVLEIGELLYDQLNDFPKVEIEAWKITLKGSGQRLFRSLKIKPKQFFKKAITAPFLHKKVHLYILFNKLESKKTSIDKEDLKTYTKRNIRTNTSQIEYYQHFSQHDIKELAAFIPEIDLHIEQLIDRPNKMSNAEIIRIQLQHFEDFINKAIRLGVSRVFIIHGIGKGRLRDEIATRLIQNPDVKTFKNEYHAKYGFGATEVFF